MDTKKLL